MIGYHKTAWEQLSQKSKLEYLLDKRSFESDQEQTNCTPATSHKTQDKKQGTVVFRLNDDPVRLDIFVMQFEPQYAKIPAHNLNSATRLATHISRALEISGKFRYLETNYSALLAALDHVSIGLSIILSDGTIINTNTEADRIMNASGLIKRSENGKITTFSNTYTERLYKAIEKVVDAPVEEPESLFRIEREDTAPVLIKASHLAISSRVDDNALSCVLLTIVDLSNSAPFDTQQLSRIYEFTDTQAAVCELLTKGFSRTEIAKSRNVSPETIKSHIAAIYKKTNTRDRVELIQLTLKTSSLLS